MILNEEGMISKGPAILQSSGYGIFNQAAIEVAKAYTQFSPAKVYIVTVPFAYSPEVCPGGSNE
jgi:outer membrane biosynthesis protein TonB